MVKVLANGDIVADDDPRAGGAPNSSAASDNRPRQGFVQNRNAGGADDVGGASQSVFGAINERLVGIGVPMWHIGPYTVDPVVSLGFLLSLLLAGFRGLLFSGVLFFIVKYSQHGWNSESRARNALAGSNANQPPPPPTTGNWPRGGHRLGRN